MIILKLFLIIILTIGFILFSFSSKMKIFQKISIILGYLTLFLFITFPHYSDKIAHLFGIGYGKDLIIYILVALTGLMNIVLYVGVNKNHAAITKIIRDGAKKNAKRCK